MLISAAPASAPPPLLERLAQLARAPNGCAAPIQNPALVGLRCLRCAQRFALQTLHRGCPACAAHGVAVSLAADYRTEPSHRIPMPFSRAVALGEGATPLISVAALARASGVARLWVKDESSNPTGSHKDRMSAVGVAHAVAAGAHTVLLASSGNAALSVAAYARQAGLACEVATYDGLGAPYRHWLAALGATCVSFADSFQRWAHVARRAQEPGTFALTNHHVPALGSAPLGVEGYKAIAQECVDADCVPRHIVVPTARGDLIWGIWAGFAWAHAAGLVPHVPRLWAVEPFARLRTVKAEAGLAALYPGSTAQFSTAGSTVTYLQWQATVQSGGGAVVVGDAAAREARRQLLAQGLAAELCAAAALAGVRQLVEAGQIAPQDDVMLILTAGHAFDPSWPDPQPSENNPDSP